MGHTLIVANDTSAKILLGLLKEAGIGFTETDALSDATSMLDNEAADIALVTPGTSLGYNRLQLLNTAIEAFVNSTEDPDEFLSTIVSEAQRITGADWVLAVRVNSHGSATRLADSGANAMRLEDATRPLEDQSHTRWIIESGEPVRIADVEAYRQHEFHTPEYGSIPINPKTQERGFRALIGVPLRSANGDKATGVMWFHYRQPQPQGWPQQVIEAIEQFARQVATAYENARRSQIVDRWQNNLTDMPLNVNVNTVDGSADDALRRIAEEICDVLNCDFATLYVDDPITYQRTACLHMRDEDVALRPYLEALPGDIVDQYLVSDAPTVRVIEDTSRDAEFRDRPATQRGGARTLIILRLQEGEHRGLAFANFRERRTFTSREITIIDLFARQLARTVENIHLYQQVVYERLRLHERFKISQLLIKGRDDAEEDRTKALENVISQAKTALVADHAGIITMQDGQLLADVVSPGAPENLVRDPHLVNLTREIVDDGRIITLDQTRNRLTRWTVNDEAETLYQETEILDHFPLLDAWPICKGFPLKDGETVLGAMWLFYKQARYSDEKVLFELQLYANFIAFAYADGLKTGRYRRAVETLRDAAQHLTIHLDTREILLETVGLARRLVAGTENFAQYFSHIALVEGYDDDRFVHFYRDQNDEQTFRYLQESAQLRADNRFFEGSRYQDDPWAPLYARDRFRTVVSRAAEMAIANQKSGNTHEALLVQDSRDDTDYVPLWGEEDFGSQLSAPIIVDNEVYGILSIEHRDRFAFDDDDRFTLMALANMVGKTLSYKWRDMYLDALREVSKHIHDVGQDRQQVMQTIVDEAVKIIRGKRPNDDFFCYIGLVEDEKLKLEAASRKNILREFGLVDLSSENDRVGVSGLVLRRHRQPGDRRQSLLLNNVDDNPIYSQQLLHSTDFTTRSQMLAWFFIDDKVSNGGGVQRGILDRKSVV